MIIAGVPLLPLLILFSFGFPDKRFALRWGGTLQPPPSIAGM